MCLIFKCTIIIINDIHVHMLLENNLYQEYACAMRTIAAPVADISIVRYERWQNQTVKILQYLAIELIDLWGHSGLIYISYFMTCVEAMQ